jgi:hypothetical protein
MSVVGKWAANEADTVSRRSLEVGVVGGTVFEWLDCKLNAHDAFRRSFSTRFD